MLSTLSKITSPVPSPRLCWPGLLSLWPGSARAQVGGSPAGELPQCEAFADCWASPVQLHSVSN